MGDRRDHVVNIPTPRLPRRVSFRQLPDQNMLPHQDTMTDSRKGCAFPYARAITTRTWANMNAVEIEEAVSQFASEPFNRAEFPFSFLAAFGNKPTTIARLRSGASNASGIPGGVPSATISTSQPALRAKPCRPSKS